MPTSTLVSADDPTSRVSALWFHSERGWSNRRIAQAIALSLLLHALLLGTLRVTAPRADGLGVFPDLFLQIELEDGRDTEHEVAAPVTKSSTSASRSELLVAPHALPQHSADVPMLPDAADPAPSEPSLPEPSALAADSGIVTTTGESYREELSAAEPDRREPERVAMPMAQQERLKRRIMQAVRSLPDAQSPQVRVSWQDEGGSYVAMLTSQPATDGMGIDRATVEIETEADGERLRMRVQMKRLAFSHFTQLVDHWDHDVQLHDDVISGRFHSNSAIILGYDRKIAPLFQGQVTTAARGLGVADTVGRRRRDEIFPQGLQTGAARIKFPDKLLAADFDQQVRNADVRRLIGDTHITFYSDGSYGWAEAGSNAREYRQMSPDMPTYLVGAPNSTLHVRGIVRGKVLVYSPERIVIEDDLTYARDPRSSPENNDYLGLVSDKYVEIASPSITGPGDLKIYAAVYARRRFVVSYLAARKTATLSIYGSLTAGSLSATEPRYATDIQFDPRFERLRPPGFPLTNQYEIETWDAQWQRLDDAQAP